MSTNGQTPPGDREQVVPALVAAAGDPTLKGAHIKALILLWHRSDSVGIYRGTASALFDDLHVTKSLARRYARYLADRGYLARRPDGALQLWINPQTCTSKSRAVPRDTAVPLRYASGTSQVRARTQEVPLPHPLTGVGGERRPFSRPPPSPSQDPLSDNDFVHVGVSRYPKCARCDSTGWIDADGGGVARCPDCNPERKPR